VSHNIFFQRRQKLLQQISDGIAIIPNANEVIRNQDTIYQYRFDSNFYYLTGFDEPESVLILDGINKKSILFCREKNIEREIWDGFRYGIEGAKEIFKFDEVYPISSFNDKIINLISISTNLYYTVGYLLSYENIIINALNKLRKMFRTGIKSIINIKDINSLIAKMRLIKDNYDKDMMTKTCNISSLAHIEAMKIVSNCNYEYEIEAKILEVFYKNGSRYPAYTPIVASGSNSCVLHYVKNNAPLLSGDLLLVDAGCEYNGYAGDITRTYPINGKFSKEQQAIYEIVLEANIQAIKEVKVGSYWNIPRDTAINVITQGLLDLGLLQGSLDDNIANEKYKKFYMHNIGHWLGLDVHDVGSYKIDDNWCKFENGMITTIEPGIYIREDINVPDKYWGIGIRIEDDILLDNNQINNLTDSVPKEIKDLEQIILGK
jgi:Xaa-Pro aminopeptidase